MQEQGDPPAWRPTVLTLAGCRDALERMDRMRQRQGEWLERLGLALRRTPSEIVHAEPGVTLRRFTGGGDGPALLIVPAPIKRSYIWDLGPGISAVQACLSRGLRVFIAEWTVPGAAESGFGLADYADRLLSTCLERAAAESGVRPVLIGHSLGGTLAAVGAALHPRLAGGLALVEAPLAFGSATGDFEAAVAEAPPARAIRESLGNVPGSFLNLASVRASPATFNWERWHDWLGCAGDAEAVRTHMLVERWTLDEAPMAGALFEDLLEQLYREDRFARGSLTVGGRAARLDGLPDHVLVVCDPRSRIIPPESAVPAGAAFRNRSLRVLHYAGDSGVALQHVGVLVGRSAHERLWPQIVDWARSLPGR